MDLLNYTTETAFLPHFKCGSLEDAVRGLVAGLAAAQVVPETDSLVAEVMRREEEGSTAVGGGLVIPHARLGAVDDVRIAVATLAEPLDLPTDDDQPVDVVILLLGPEGDPRKMLRVLARLARLVKQDDFLQGLREAGTRTDLRSAFALAR
ncbi:MAG: PTS sugar transporter subunit IIA [Candidatus Krumholzibacteriia bacterium]